MPPPDATQQELPLRVIRPSAIPAPLELRCRCGTARTANTDSALIRIAAHSLTCQRGIDAARRDPSRLPGEQPARLVRVPRQGAESRVALVCVCGAEAAWWRWGSHSESVRLRTHFRWPSLGADLGLDALGQLLRHCGACASAQLWADARPLPAAIPAGALW